MLGREIVLYLLAQRHDRAHVGLVIRGQHGSRVLRFLQAARDGLAQPGHLHALFALAGLARRRLLRHGGRFGCARTLLDGFQRITLGHAAIAARAFDVRQIDRVFPMPRAGRTAWP